MTARSAAGRAFMASLQEGRDYDKELAAQQLAEAYHSVACGIRKWPADHQENEVVLFRVVLDRLKKPAA